MMRPVLLALPPLAPTVTFDAGTLSWTDASISETAYAVEKLVNGVWTEVWRTDRALTVGNSTGEALSYTDTLAASGDRYRVVAENKVGDTWNYADPNLNELLSGGFPTVTARSFTEVAAP